MGETAPLNGDRSAAPTGGNQSGRPESMRITKEIRQQIIERRELSTAAKNVKVITDDKGAVTLRGPVKTDDERRELEQIARNNAQGGQVNNQLVVKGEEPSRGGAHG
jgi:osmotically-inducible protein OsmY